MPESTAIHGHEIIELVGSYPEGIRIGQLADLVNARYGPAVSFHTCSALGMDLDALLDFLAARDKVQIRKGVVFPGGSPACGH